MARGTIFCHIHCLTYTIDTLNNAILKRLTLTDNPSFDTELHTERVNIRIHGTRTHEFLYSILYKRVCVPENG